MDYALAVERCLGSSEVRGAVPFIDDEPARRRLEIANSTSARLNRRRASSAQRCRR
jgi:hypothetical protein